MAVAGRFRLHGGDTLTAAVLCALTTRAHSAAMFNRSRLTRVFVMQGEHAPGTRSVDRPIFAQTD